MTAIVLTGFPGFLASALVHRLLDSYPDDTYLACIVQSKFKQMALQRAAAIEQASTRCRGRIRLYEGDITFPDLGLGGERDQLAKETKEIYHLAAVYDLAVKREIGMRVNVDGTRHVLHFAESCADLGRLHYVSTCYVSGRYLGRFAENDLQKGQKFNNCYEETKYLAEVEVQQFMRNGLPATIYRPAIVVGDSKTGATQKYDGPYYLIQWILRQPRFAVVPTVGSSGRYRVNLAPSDFVVNAISYLSRLEASLNKVYQLCDPDPPTVAELLDILEVATGRKLVRLVLPKKIAKGALLYIPGVYAIMRIEPEAIEYFVHPTTYSCDNALRDLQGSGICCPPFAAYANRLVTFMKTHPHVSSAAMA